MTIRVFNTLSKNKEELQPIQPGRIGMYLCGPTVYKPSHIGHMVGPVIFDVVKRHLTYSGYKVTWVVNITDVDDKLIVESQKRGLTMAQVAEEMTADYMANLAAMGVDSIDHFPKATEHMAEIIKFNEELIAGGYAYATPKGDVYFDVAKDAEYGKLSGRSIDQMQGEGGEHASVKRSPFDFALWKSAKPGEPSWTSPWGEGRPGWHIECSAMSRKILGKTFDIHGGGLDLQFPHHENEIAQSECCHHAPQAKYWMHNGLMQAADEAGKVGGRPREAGADQATQEAGKIGKSKGAQPFKELLAKVPAETIRYFLLMTQYRRPITYSEELMGECGTRLESFYRFFQRFQRVTGKNFYDLPIATDRKSGDAFDPAGVELLTEVKTIRDAFLASMDDDFNTAGAIAELNKLLSLINRFIDAEKLEAPGASADGKVRLEKATAVFRELAGILGLFRAAPVSPTASASQDDALAGKLVELLIVLRAELRKAKNFELADRIRKELTALGVTLEDRPGGTGYEIKKPHMLQRDAAHANG